MAYDFCCSGHSLKYDAAGIHMGKTVKQIKPFNVVAGKVASKN
jgi:hypothetical protein